MVNIIKNKRDGTIKGRTCENGSKKIQYSIEVGSIESLTVSLEALFITSIIDTYKERYVTTFDATGAYLHAKMPEGKKFLLKLRGHFVYIMCDIKPEHKANVRHERDQEFIYLRGLMAIYG